MTEVTTEWQNFDQLSAYELYALLRFRQSIFVVEQASPYPDLDGLDQNAWHLLLRCDGELAAYARLTPQPLRIGRVAVAAAMRGRGLGRRLMEEALLFCRERFPAQPIALAAQLHLAHFYESFGFRAVPDTYDDFGVPHVDMTLLSRI
jgi:ElaA protein